MGDKCTINMSFSTDEENQEFFKSVDKLNKLLKCQREEGLSVENIENKVFAEDEVCPECGQPVDTTYSRIVGFYVPIRTYSKPRLEEWKMRDWMSLSEKGVNA